MSVRRRLSMAACLVSFVPAVVHEVTHYLAALPVAEDAAFRVEVTGTEAVAVWEPIENPVFRAFAFLAPTVFGTLLTALWLATDVSVSGWRLPFLAGLALYTVPSPADVRGAIGRPKQETDPNN